MKTNLFINTAILFLLVFTACRSEDEQEITLPDPGDLKAASANTLNYDSFSDEMDFLFTNYPACPENPGTWTRCGHSDNGRWARLSWNWSACPISPYLVTVTGENLLMEVPGNYTWMGGQIESIRNDYGFGRYRARIKAGTHSGTVANGTCSAFFFYNSATTQEIDVEILNREGKVHFVTHPGDNQIVYTLPENFSTEFIEYGFDWYKSRIDFFVNGTKVTPSQTRSVPSVRGTIMLNHWTGNPGWSGTPQPDPSFMAVDYVKHTPFLLVTFPDGMGITWDKGTKKTITWESIGDLAANKVNIEIWKGGKLYKTIASRISNINSFTFTMPTSYPAATNYRVKVKSTLSSDYYDFGNADFTVR